MRYRSQVGNHLSGQKYDNSHKLSINCISCGNEQHELLYEAPNLEKNEIKSYLMIKA